MQKQKLSSYYRDSKLTEHIQSVVKLLDKHLQWTLFLVLYQQLQSQQRLFTKRKFLSFIVGGGVVNQKRMLFLSRICLCQTGFRLEVARSKNICLGRREDVCVLPIQLFQYYSINYNWHYLAYRVLQIYFEFVSIVLRVLISIVYCLGAVSLIQRYRIFVLECHCTIGRGEKFSLQEFSLVSKDLFPSCCGGVYDWCSTQYMLRYQR